uniref:Uncharacterized protein n=1 Tax=Salix viminalis TaxID=40686 RepID=A0A6N2KY46_SALVM
MFSICEITVCVVEGGFHLNVVLFLKTSNFSNVFSSIFSKSFHIHKTFLLDYSKIYHQSKIRRRRRRQNKHQEGSKVIGIYHSSELNLPTETQTVLQSVHSVGEVVGIYHR